MMSHIILSRYFPAVLSIAFISAFAGEMRALEHPFVKSASLILLITTVIIRVPVQTMVPLVLCSIIILTASTEIGDTKHSVTREYIA